MTTGWEDYTPAELEQIKNEKLRLKMKRLAAEMAAQSGLSVLDDPEQARDWLQMRSQQPQAGAAELNLTDKDFDRLYAVAEAIAEERIKKQEQMRRALLAGDNDNALSIARELCGIEVGDEEGNRTSSRVH